MFTKHTRKKSAHDTFTDLILKIFAICLIGNVFLFFLIQIYEIKLEQIDDAPPRSVFPRRNRIFKIMTIFEPRSFIIKHVKKCQILDSTIRCIRK